MISLPKIKRSPKETAHLCKCRPICKSRRREWHGVTQKTSPELLLERKPLPDCFRRWPGKGYANGPCPLFERYHRISVKKRFAIHERKAVRICQASIDDTVDTTYLKFAELAKQVGAWDAVKSCCAFCICGSCCPCGVRDYTLRDAEGLTRRRTDMRDFDVRVKNNYQTMRIMYK